MTWQSLLTTMAVLYAIMLVRYFAVSGLFYWALWKRDPEKVGARRLTSIEPKPNLVRAEIRWSLISSAIFTIPGALVIEVWNNGGTALYENVSDYGWPYLFFSIVLYLFLHDTYFYWGHRLMHHPKIFRVVHKVHHDSRQPTPWAAFSFHPYEATILAIIIPLLVLTIPIHIGAIVLILMIMTVFGVINHAGWEVFPDSWMRGAFGKTIISAAHHNLHHQHYRNNFALYFRFWDKLMGTDVMETEYDFLKTPAPAE